MNILKENSNDFIKGIIFKYKKQVINCLLIFKMQEITNINELYKYLSNSKTITDKYFSFKNTPNAKK